MAYDEWFGYDRDFERRYRVSPRGRQPDARGAGYAGEYWPPPGGLRPPHAWRHEWAGEWGSGGFAGRRDRGALRRATYDREYSGSAHSRQRSRRDRAGNFPPEYRRYLSQDEYGLGPGWARGGREHGHEIGERTGRRSRGPQPFNEGVLGPRNALFGREGFRRYGEDYEQW